MVKELTGKEFNFSPDQLTANAEGAPHRLKRGNHNNASACKAAAVCGFRPGLRAS
jgi:hypothetical protein